MPFNDAPTKLLVDDGSDTGPLIYISGSHYQRLIRTIENAATILENDPSIDHLVLLAKDLRGVVDKSYRKVYPDASS